MTEKRYEKRVQRFQEALRKREIDGAIISSWPNIEYLTGLRSLQSMINSFDPMPLVVPASGTPAYVCTMIYAKVIKAEYPNIDPFAFSEDSRLYPKCDRWEAAQTVLASLGLERSVIGYEEASLTVRHRDQLQRAIPNVMLVTVDDMVPELRLYKDEEELDALREASRITDLAFRRVLTKGIKEGITEHDLEVLLASAITEEGALPSFIQVFAGKRACFGNIAPSTHYRVKKGDVILLDFGVTHRGCGTDITRPIVIGSAAPRQKEIAGAVKEIFQCILAGVRPGIAAGEIDKLAQRCFAEAGFAEAYIHRTGHGMGTRPWERPALSEVDETILAPNMVISVEQGIYLAEESLGIRLEDNIIVTEDGFEDMNHLSLDLVEL